MVPTSLPKANINQAIALIRLSDEGRSQLLPDFLKYELHGEVTKGQIRSGAAQLAQANLNLKQVGELKLLLPPLPEQRKIAAILSSVDEAIEGTEAVIDQLQVVKKAIMADLLTRGIPGRHKKFKQTEIGEVPADWEITTVGKVGEFSGGNGFRPPDWSSAGLPIIRIQNLNGSQDFNYFARKPDLDWLVEPGELLFAWAGSRGASFGPCIWPGPQGVLNQHIHRIKPFPSIRKRFFFYLLQIITQEVEKKAHGFKDTLVHLRKAELTNWPVALPPIAEQDLIVASLDSAADRLRSEEAALNGLKGTRSALMSVLLTGEVRVRLEDEAACD
jgi:type I restriction enzyme S subunit